MTAEEKETLKEMISNEYPCHTCLVNRWSCCGCPKETNYTKRQKIYMTKLNLNNTEVTDELTTLKMLYGTIEKLKAEIDTVETRIKKHKKTIMKNFDITNEEIDELISS